MNLLLAARSMPHGPGVAFGSVRHVAERGSHTGVRTVRSVQAPNGMRTERQSWTTVHGLLLSSMGSMHRGMYVYTCIRTTYTLYPKTLRPEWCLVCVSVSVTACRYVHSGCLLNDDSGCELSSAYVSYGYCAAYYARRLGVRTWWRGGKPRTHRPRARTCPRGEPRTTE